MMDFVFKMMISICKSQVWIFGLGQYAWQWVRL